MTKDNEASVPERMPLSEGRHTNVPFNSQWTIPGIKLKDPSEIKKIVPKIIPIEQLDPAKQQELKTAFKDLTAELTPEQEAFVQRQTNSNPDEPIEPPAVVDGVQEIESKPTKVEVILCPNCGWDHSVQPSKPTQEDRDEFVLKTLNGTSFERTYSLFGGKAAVTFRARTFEENRLIMDQLSAEIREGRISNESSGVGAARYHARLRELQLAASFSKLLPRNSNPLPLVTSEVYKPTDEYNCMGVAFLEVFKGWPEPLYAAVYNAQFVFEQLVFNLIEAASSESFWKDPAGAA